MYGTCLLFSGFSNVCHSACVWPTALKLGCVTNFDMLFLVMGFISLVDGIQFLLISSRNICLYISFLILFINASDLELCTRSYNSCVYHMMRFKCLNGKVCKMTSHFRTVFYIVRWITCSRVM